MSFKNYRTMDFNLLLGLVNTALRNDCESLDDLVKRHDLDREALCRRLEEIGMVYYPEINQFRPADSDD